MQKLDQSWTSCFGTIHGVILLSGLIGFICIQLLIIKSCLSVVKLTKWHDSMKVKGTVPNPWIPFMRPSSTTLPPLWLMLIRSLLLAPIRMLIIVVAVVITTSLASFLNPKAALKVASVAGKVVWRAAGVRSVRFIGAPAPSREAPLVVVNHISWIDFMIMGATTQFAFVMSESVSNAPVVGKGFVKLARHVDSIILNRGSEESRNAAKAKISEKLRNMMNVATSSHLERLLIFPEGTLTNGSCVVPFKLGAFEPLVPVQPLRLEYTDPHYSICDLGTVEGIAFMMCLGGTDVTCTWGPVVTPSPTDTPQSLAEKARAALVKGSDMKLAKEGGFRDHMALYMTPINS